MIARFEELDWQETRMGELTLRRRADPVTGELIYEVKLKDEYLMSSLFTVAEEELATLGLAAAEGVDLDVLVGGLGLGYTAATALLDERVRRLDVIDALPAVIGWHERELLPVSAQLVRDPRVTLVHDDFFAVVRRPPEPDDARYDVILLDVDHSPRHTLDPSHADLYTVAGLESLARHLDRPGRLRPVVGRSSRRRLHGHALLGFRRQHSSRRELRQPAHRRNLVEHGLRRDPAVGDPGAVPRSALSGSADSPGDLVRVMDGLARSRGCRVGSVRRRRCRSRAREPAGAARLFVPSIANR